MSEIKSYTDIEQSKKLAKILPIESADMCCFQNQNGSINYYGFPFLQGNKDSNPIPCWSLASLLDIFPKDEGIDCSISFGYYNGKGEYIEKWLCAFEKEGETTDGFIIETIDGDNPVDACVAMVEKLNELNLL